MAWALAATEEKLWIDLNVRLVELEQQLPAVKTPR